MERKMTFEDFLHTIGQVHSQFKSGGYCDLVFFNQNKKRISNGKIVLMDDGKIIPQTVELKCGLKLELTEDMELSNEFNGDPYERLEELYYNYKHSVPNESDSYARCNFRAKKLNELSRKDMERYVKRNEARIALESFVMLHKFPWKNERHHFWQSEKDGDLILFREWAI